MFWVGLAIGMFIGANFGFLIAALFAAARYGDVKTRAALAKIGISNSSVEDNK